MKIYTTFDKARIDVGGVGLRFDYLGEDDLGGLRTFVVEAVFLGKSYLFCLHLDTFKADK